MVVFPICAERNETISFYYLTRYFLNLLYSVPVCKELLDFRHTCFLCYLDAQLHQCMRLLVFYSTDRLVSSQNLLSELGTITSRADYSGYNIQVTTLINLIAIWSLADSLITHDLPWSAVSAQKYYYILTTMLYYLAGVRDDYVKHAQPCRDFCPLHVIPSAPEN